jgi:beta-glucosidase
MKIKKQFLQINIVVLVLLVSSFGCKVNQDSVSQNQTSGTVDSLLNLMTLEEKIGQLTLFTSDWVVTGPTLRENYKEDIKSGKVGSIFNAHTAEYTCDLQRLAVEETRLGIPLLFGYDVIHGYKTIFPISLGEAASWDLEAIEKSAQIAAEESTAAGLHWTFAPMVDIARDPRWGRISEGAGEDVYYGNLVAKARVKGFQGKDINDPNTMIACAKHYAAYGAAQAGRDYHTVDISERTLREIYLPPFKATIDAGVRTFMTSFNEINGVPASGSKRLMTDILRGEWGFEGFVVTDYTSINEMVDHGNVADEKEAGALALNAGVDMDMQGAVYYNYLAESVKEGVVSETQIDVSVRRILAIKEELGLFKDPYKYCNPSREKETILSVDHLAFARDVSRKSIVLLKNENEVLPISKETKIALIGPLANSQPELLGSWHGAGDAKDCITPLKGFHDQTEAKISYALGCDIKGDRKTGFKEAIDLAKTSDIVLLVIGEGANMSGEAASRTNINLPGVQLDLAKALVETGKPVVVILMNGRPLSIPWLDKNVDGILETWFLGTQAGNAIADVVYGAYNPSGKLPVTFPRNVGQVPIFYYMKNTGRPFEADDKYTTKYLDVENTPLYPFGYGLSYTKFEYSNLKVSKTTFEKNDELNITVDVANTGKYDGEEVVQMYVRDLVGSVTRPVRELKGFEKVFIEKGKTKTVSFTLSAQDLKFYDIDMKFTTEPGDFEIFIGTNSDATLSKKIKLL